MKTVLVTGAAGFIGSHLVQANVAAGFKVEALVKPGDPGIKSLRRLGVDVLIGDICDCHEVEHAIEGVDTLFHSDVLTQAGQSTQLYRRVNVDAMKILCEAALKKKVKRMVYVSSHDLFGYKQNKRKSGSSRDGLIDEGQPYRYWGESMPDSLMDGAQVAWQYHAEGLPLTMAYAGPVYGPGHGFLHGMAGAISRGENFYFHADGPVFPVYIQNLIHLLMLLAENPGAVGEGFLVHDKGCGSWSHLIEKAARAVGSARPANRTPYPAALLSSKLREKIRQWRGEVCPPLKTVYTVKKHASNLRFTGAKAEQRLGWNPPVSQEEGIQITLKDYVKITPL